MRELFENLNENIKKHDEVIIMTHSRPDLDGMGSALALYKIIESMDRKCYIVSPLKKLYRSLDKAMKLLDDNGINFEFKDEKEIINSKHVKPLLIILDTQEPELVESDKVLDLINDKIVLMILYINIVMRINLVLLRSWLNI